jgi:hypothetical protein
MDSASMGFHDYFAYVRNQGCGENPGDKLFRLVPLYDELGPWADVANAQRFPQVLCFSLCRAEVCRLLPTITLHH